MTRPETAATRTGPPAAAAVALTVPARYNGPPDSGHGGYVCGRLARLAASTHGASVAVTLLAPTPLATELAFVPDERRSRLTHGSRLIATVRAGTVLGEPPAPLTETAARRAARRFPGAAGHHPFPTCFACGQDRPADDGLTLTPGPVDGRPGTAACVWTPHERDVTEVGTVAPELVWSALDCPGGWTDDPVRTPRLLSHMAAELRRLPRPGEHCVVVAHGAAAQGRTIQVATALYDPSGALLARASARWVAVEATPADVPNAS